MMTTREFDKAQETVYVPYYNNAKWGVQPMELHKIRIMPSGHIMYRGWIYGDMFFNSESDAWKWIRKE